MRDDRISILLLEDDPDDALLVRETLGDAAFGRYQVEHVECLQDALDRICGNAYDVMISDLGLPDSEGLETFRRIHSRAPELPVVVLTGLDDDCMALTAVREGAQDYLVKSQTGGTPLVRAMRYAIERQRRTHSGAD